MDFESLVNKYDNYGYINLLKNGSITTLEVIEYMIETDKKIQMEFNGEYDIIMEIINNYINSLDAEIDVECEVSIPEEHRYNFDIGVHESQNINLTHVVYTIGKNIAQHYWYAMIKITTGPEPDDYGFFTAHMDIVVDK